MRNVMKIDEVSSCLDKIDLYREQEQLLNDDIRNCLGSFKNVYQSNNSLKIENITNELSNKIRVISNIHDNNVKVIQSALNKYKNQEIKAQKIFEDIEIR